MPYVFSNARRCAETSPCRRSFTSTRRFFVVCCATVCALAARSSGAQSAPQVGFLDVGGERERLLRALQLTGDIPVYPWSIRQLSPSDLDRLQLTEQRLSSLLPASPTTRTLAGARVQLLPLDTRVIYNSAFAYGFNDGPVWAGRGVTGVLSTGVAGRWGALSFQLEPLAFAAQNSSFALRALENSPTPYANAYNYLFIDLPQRFGDRAYRRLDPGQSSIRLDVRGLAAELSTANQVWGPALESPIILGNDGPGFLHATLGTSHPINVGIGQVHARAVWGRLEQSAYSPLQGGDSLRFMSGTVAVFLPRGTKGLEIGFARFFHTAWPEGGLRDAPFFRPFEAIFKNRFASADNPQGNNPDNQLASVFVRWALAPSGLEVYGEYGREDHNADARDFYQEPDHDSAYLLGLQRAWVRRGPRLVVFRAEVLNARISHLYQGRGQTQWYVHGTVRQGHTNLGQLLGSQGVFGGAAALLGVDSYSPAGRWSAEWDRILRGETTTAEGAPIPLHSDVMHALRVERVQRMKVGSLSIGMDGVWNLNRYFVRDRFNLNARVGSTLSW